MLLRTYDGENTAIGLNIPLNMTEEYSQWATVF